MSRAAINLSLPFPCPAYLLPSAEDVTLDLSILRFSTFHMPFRCAPPVHLLLS